MFALFIDLLDLRCLQFWFDVGFSNIGPRHGLGWAVELNSVGFPSDQPAFNNSAGREHDFKQPATSAG